MFMDFLGYGNHVELYSEEISRGGEGLGVSGVGLFCIIFPQRPYSSRSLHSSYFHHFTFSLSALPNACPHPDPSLPI